MTPLMYFMCYMFIRTAQINDFFEIQRQLIQKIKFIIRQLQNLPFEIYFSDEGAEEHIETHNEYLYFAIEFLKEKHMKEHLEDRIPLQVLIQRDLKNIMQVYDYCLETLEFDRENNCLRILGIPVTKKWLKTIIIPLMTSGFAAAFDYINQ